MKLLAFFSTLLIATVGLAQIPEVKKASCVRTSSKGGARYGEWECGKRPGVVDCNDKLVFDEDSKLVVSGNQGIPFTGTCETCHMNGRLERTVKFENGLQAGIDTTYYESGCPQVIQNHFQGKENGQWVYFFDTTNMIAWEQNYAYGNKHGKSIWLTRDGDTSRFELYNNGLLHGTKKLYYSKSRIEKEIPYVNGVMDGVFKHYNVEGVVLDEINYKQGKRNGEAKYFFDDGKPLRTENWNMDTREGEFKTFYYQGHIQTLEVYKKGVPEGWWEERYPDDKVKSRKLYKKGVVIEEFKYDANGNEIEHIGGTKSTGKYDETGPETKDSKKKK